MEKLQQGALALPDYEKYHLNKREWIKSIGKSAALIGVLAYLFYRSWWAVPVLSPITIWIIHRDKKRRTKEQLQQLNVQFLDGLQAVSSSLQAGWSVENAFREGLKDLLYIYGKNGLIVKEFEYIVGGIDLNEPLEALLESFARRSGLEDVKMFSEVFSIAKRTRGDVIQIICQTANSIGDKIMIQREIYASIHGKQLEQKIMNGMPCAILLYVRFCSPDFLAPLYGHVLGVLIMSGCLLIYGAAVILAEKIIDIPV